MTLRISQKQSTLLAYFAAACGALLATVLMTWPLAYYASDHVLKAIYYWDAYCNTMILGSRVDAVTGAAPLSLYDNYFFAPLPNSIVFNENHFGLSLIFAPFYLISRNPLWAYNMTLMGSMALSVIMTFLLVRRLTKSALSGFIAGVAFTFCPYVLFEVGRIQLVATQWIPALFLFLHRTIEHRRLRDSAAFWSIYVLQIGTCLYYAMFLIPLLSVAGLLLFVGRRPTKLFLAQFAGCGLIAGCVALAMVYPYFSARHLFDLERTLDFAASYDGKLGFFSNVHPTNRSLSFLHHISTERGAREEIAFPGFTLSALALLALLEPLLVKANRWRPSLQSVGPLWLTALSVATALVAHSVLFGLVLLGCGFFWMYRQRLPTHFAPRDLYLLVGCVSLLMFLGLYPLEFRGEPVHGLYYYFHTYFPGFNGIRKVSRQAVMVTFLLSVLAGLGAKYLFARLDRPSSRLSAFALLLAALFFELRTFPHPLEQAWAAERVPTAISFMKQLPPRDLVASHPQNTGTRTFVGDAGMAYNDYLALYHKHRFVNGQSSFLPQVTDLVLRSLDHLPNPSSTELLWQVGVRHLLVFGADLPPRQRGLVGQLEAQPELYRKVHADGQDAVFSLVRAIDNTDDGMLDTPALPKTARAVPASALLPSSSLQKARLKYATDGRLDTHWSTRTPQASRQYFEVSLDRTRPIVALEIENPKHEMYLPLSYSISGSNGHGETQVIIEQAELRIFRDQVFAPKAFIYRVVFNQAVEVDRLRLSINTPMPGYDFVIHEVRIYEDFGSRDN